MIFSNNVHLKTNHLLHFEKLEINVWERKTNTYIASLSSNYFEINKTGPVSQSDVDFGAVKT